MPENLKNNVEENEEEKQKLKKVIKFHNIKNFIHLLDTSGQCHSRQNTVDREGVAAA